MLKNFHTHTYRCKHASGDVDDYALSAVRKGVSVLGFTDHTPLPDNRWPGMRMKFEELPGYIKAIDNAQKKYREIKLLKGLECEYHKKYHNFYQDELMGEHNIDYLISGAHFFPYRGEWVGLYGGVSRFSELKAYADYVIEAIASEMFAFFAHPDLFANSYKVWTDEAKACSRSIIEAAVEYNVPLEINSYGFRKKWIDTPEGKRPMYPWKPFWRLAAEYDTQVIINSDAHRPEDVVEGIYKAKELANSFDLNIVSECSFI